MSNHFHGYTIQIACHVKPLTWMHIQLVTHFTDTSTVRINYLCAYDSTTREFTTWRDGTTQRPYNIVIDAHTLNHHISVLGQDPT